MHEQGFGVRTRGLCPGAGAFALLSGTGSTWSIGPLHQPARARPKSTHLHSLHFFQLSWNFTAPDRRRQTVLMLPSSCFSSGNSRLPSTSQGVGKLKAQLRCFFLLFPFAFPLPLFPSRKFKSIVLLGHKPKYLGADILFSYEKSP